MKEVEWKMPSKQVIAVILLSTLYFLYMFFVGAYYVATTIYLISLFYLSNSDKMLSKLLLLTPFVICGIYVVFEKIFKIMLSEI